VGHGQSVFLIVPPQRHAIVLIGILRQASELLIIHTGADAAWIAPVGVARVSRLALLVPVKQRLFLIGGTCQSLPRTTAHHRERREMQMPFVFSALSVLSAVNNAA
jgi:hypothetical protein